MIVAGFAASSDAGAGNRHQPLRMIAPGRAAAQMSGLAKVVSGSNRSALRHEMARRVHGALCGVQPARCLDWLRPPG